MNIVMTAKRLLFLNRSRMITLSPLVKYITVIIIVLSFVQNAETSTYLPLGDEAYMVLARLEAEGVVQSGLTSMKPLSRQEVARLAAEAVTNYKGNDPNIIAMAEYLKARFSGYSKDERLIKPVDSLSFNFSYNSSNVQALNYNNDGDQHRKGFNERFGFESLAEFGWIAFDLAPEIRYPDNETRPIDGPVGTDKKSAIVCGVDCYAEFERNKDVVVRLKKAYGVLSLLGLDLTVGKDSQWWGPGYHGALLLSNNAEPFAMVRLENSEPVLLPWIFKYLGPFRWTFFVTQLEHGRLDVPDPYLWGMRVGFKPHPNLELGLQRIAILGGKGRSSDFKTWLKSFTGEGENVSGKEAGDQKAGIDLKLTLPMRIQPVQLYAEVAGEDEAGGLPSRIGYRGGISLPRVLSADRLGFRAEYAINHIGGQPFYWYSHHIYTSGYTYNGDIIGHHMGSDSKDLSVELSYRFGGLEDYIRLAYDREEHNLSGSVRPTKDEAVLSVDYKVMRNASIGVSFGYGRLKNFEFTAGSDKKSVTADASIRYTF